MLQNGLPKETLLDISKLSRENKQNLNHGNSQWNNFTAEPFLQAYSLGYVAPSIRHGEVLSKSALPKCKTKPSIADFSGESKPAGKNSKNGIQKLNCLSADLFSPDNSSGYVSSSNNHDHHQLKRLINKSQRTKSGCILPIATASLSGVFQNVTRNPNNGVRKMNWQTVEPPAREITLGKFACPRIYHQVQLNSFLSKTAVAVKYQNREEVLVQIFAELYLQRHSADVSIMCGRNYTTFKAHRFVLSFGSIFFRNALEASPSKNPVIAVKSIPVEVMEQVLEYMYLGEVKLKRESELKQFLSAAKYLMLTGIR